jgi:hypothetical protein
VALTKGDVNERFDEAVVEQIVFRTMRRDTCDLLLVHDYVRRALRARLAEYESSPKSLSELVQADFLPGRGGERGPDRRRRLLSPS